MRNQLMQCLVIVAFAVFAQAENIRLPLDRTNYFAGEYIPMGIPADGEFVLEAVDSAGNVVAKYSGSETALKLGTSALAPGTYELRLNGEPAGTVDLSTTLRDSVASMQDEFDAPQGRTEDERKRITAATQEAGVTALMSAGYMERGQYGAHELLAPAGTMIFVNPYSRPLSFNSARIYEPEMKTFRHRLAMMAQANNKYPTFGGYYYDWDPVGHLARKMLLFYWGWGQQEQNLRDYIDRSDKAVYDEFRRRTGLEPVSTTEYITYCLSIGRPEFAPAIDLPTHRWINEMAENFEPLQADELAQLEKRIDAWADYLMGIYGENYVGHNEVLRRVDPSLRHTSSVNLDHSPVRKGQYIPWSYAPLDFRYMTAWNDQIAGPDYTFQWLFTAGLLDIGRPEHMPTWVSSCLGVVHGLADYPGRFMRAAGHNLAYGGSGLGFAYEGFSNVTGGMNRGTYWENIKGKSGEADLAAGRDFLKRFASLALEAERATGVAVLFSRHQMARQHITQAMGTPQFNAFITLARLGYTPRFLDEDQILADALNRHSTLVIVNQSVPLPDDVMTKLQAFQAAGGRIVIDKASELTVNGAEVMDVTMHYAVPGKPHNWTSSNVTRVPHALINEKVFDNLATPVLAALGNNERTPLITEKGPDTKVSTFAINGGRDATYVVAVNDAIQTNQSNWYRITERLLPNGDIEGVLYDLTSEKRLGAVEAFDCEFNDVTARVFGILPRPLKEIDLRATQNLLCGQELRLTVRFTDNAGEQLEAVIPFQLSIIKPDGTEAQQLYRSTDRAGNFAMSWTVPANAATGRWQLTVRALLDGSTATLPLDVRPAPEARQTLAAIKEPVVVRNADGIRDLLTQGGEIVLPLLGMQEVLMPVAETLRDELAQIGVKVVIVDEPEITTYTVSYTPTEEEAVQNTRAENGDAIGRIRITTVNRNDWSGTLSGYIYGRNVILLDLAGEKDNEMAERLQSVGMLWPVANEHFPGKGRAVIQLVKDAFLLGRDTIVIQASDINGLMTGVRNLRNLPEDWIGDSVAQARRELLGGFGIIREAREISTDGLTAENITRGSSPQPLVIAFPGAEPPTAADVRPFIPPSKPYNEIPAEFETSKGIAHYFVNGQFEEASMPGGNWVRDTRFNDAFVMKVDVKEPGVYKITISGKMRYSDRRPAMQPLWEDLLVLYNESVQKPRLPVYFDVKLNGEDKAQFTEVVTEDIEVITSFGGIFGHAKPPTVVEEGVVAVRGSIELPAGKHKVMFIHRNIVDGLIEKVAFER